MLDFNILEIIKPYSEIAIIGHVKPDLDAIGSCMAIALCLKKLGKKPKVFLQVYNEKYDFVSGKEFLIQDESFKVKPEVCIISDCGDVDRIPRFAKSIYEDAIVTINIDHHKSNNNYGDYNYVDAKASSASELVYEIFSDIVEIDKDIATAIYAGIISDSGGLRFPSTTSNTMSVAAKLMETGIDFTSIYNQAFIKKRMEEVVALREVINRLEVCGGGKFNMSYIRLDDMAKIGIDRNDLEGVVQFILNIDNAEVSAFIYEMEKDLFKVSFRSLKLDVNKICNRYNGGGHVLAAGCTMSGEFSEIYDTIKNILISELA